MMINGRTAGIRNGALVWRGQAYPLDGAHASYTETRRGIPLVSRRTCHTVTIDGNGWQVIGTARILFPAFRSQRRAVQRFVMEVNTHRRAS